MMTFPLLLFLRKKIQVSIIDSSSFCTRFLFPFKFLSSFFHEEFHLNSCFSIDSFLLHSFYSPPSFCFLTNSSETTLHVTSKQLGTFYLLSLEKKLREQVEEMMEMKGKRKEVCENKRRNFHQLLFRETSEE